MHYHIESFCHSVMRPLRTRLMTASVALALLILWGGATAEAFEVRVKLTNNAPAGGVYLTPAWVGFHDGSFDALDVGSAASAELERLAEDGNPGPLSTLFGSVASRVQGGLGAAPIAPGTSVSADFSLTMGGPNRYFSFATMVLPSNDYFLANDDPLQHDLAVLGGQVGASHTFHIGLPGTVLDAGTELNFENLGMGTVDASVAGLGLLGPGYVGQSAPDTGTAEGGVTTAVAGSPYGDDLLVSHPGLDFNDASRYPMGIATIEITVLPEPSSLLLAGASLLGLAVASGRRRAADRLAPSH